MSGISGPAPTSCGRSATAASSSAASRSSESRRAGARGSVVVTSPPASSARCRRRRPAAGRARARRPSRRQTISRARSASSAGPSNSSSSWICRTAASRRPGVAQRVVGAHHRDLDHVGRGALDDGVDGEPLAELAHLAVARAQLGDLAAAPEQRRDVAVLGRLLDRRRDERLHGREALEVAVDELLRLLARDLQPVGEAEGREAVDDPVVDHLRLRARAGVELLGRDAEDRRGGRGVDVLAAAEDVLQHLLAGDVREHAQLDLRVVDREQHVARLGDEAGADLAPEPRADRDVLQVRVDRGEPAGRRVHLAERRVQAAVAASISRGSASR